MEENLIKVGKVLCGRYLVKSKEIGTLEVGTIYEDSLGSYAISFDKDPLNTTKNYKDTGINVGPWLISKIHFIELVPNNKLSKLLYPEFIESECGIYLIPKKVV